MKLADLTKEDLVALVNELVNTLEYCGWGDAWEREGSEDLRDRIGKFEDVL